MLASARFGFNALVKGDKGPPALIKAAEQGEVHVLYAGLSEVRRLHGSLLSSGPLVPVVQLARTSRHPDLPDIPTGRELLSKSEDVALLKFVESVFYVSRPISGPPEVPADRLAALRGAFNKIIVDPEFLAEAKKTNIDISPLTGEQVTEIMKDMVATPPSVTRRYKDVLGLKF